MICNSFINKFSILLHISCSGMVAFFGVLIFLLIKVILKF